MAHRQSSNHRHGPYPYTIPIALLPSEETLARSDPSMVLEFFRIEALLRSEDVHRLYQLEEGEDILLSRYLFNWSVLNGRHHSLLVGGEDNGPYHPMMPIVFGSHASGVLDLSGSLRGLLDPKWTSEFQAYIQRDQFMKDLQHKLLVPKGSKIYLEVDTAYPWKGIANDLHNLYEAHRLKTGTRNPEPFLMPRSESCYQIPTVPQHNPLIRSPKAWLSYLQCYDLRHCEGLSFGEIAKKVLHAPSGQSQQQTKKRNRLYHEAKRAHYKVSALIHFAESRSWPPDEAL